LDAEVAGIDAQQQAGAFADRVAVISSMRVRLVVPTSRSAAPERAMISHLYVNTIDSFCQFYKRKSMI